MDRSALRQSIRKLAMAGEQAGFTVEQMMQLLKEGVDIKTLISLIEWKILYNDEQPSAPHQRWVC